MKIAAALALIAALLSPPAFAAGAAEVTIAGGRGSHKFMAEIAETEGEIQQGLMFRDRLAPGTGMIFVFPEVGYHSFWMKNTIIPLDIVFANEDGNIRYIRHRAVPRSEALINPPEPVAMVLELPGGTAARLGISEGDTLTMKRLSNP